MRRSRIVIGVVIGLLVAAAVATTASSHKRDAEPIVFGMAIDQTGFGSSFDLPGANAMEIAIADQNAKGGLLGRPIKTIYSDAKTTIDGSATAGAEVVAKGANFVISTCDYDFGGPAARVGNEHKLVSFSMCAGSPKFGVQGIGPYAFTPNAGTPTEGAAMAEFAYLKGWRKPYLLIDTLVEYSKTLCGYFETRWKQLAGKSIVGKDLFSNGDPSIQSQVTRMRSAKKADSVILCSFVPGGPAAVKQIRGGGIKLPILAGDGMDGAFWLKAIPNLKDFYFITQVSVYGDDPRPAVNAFVKAYTKKYGAPPPTGFSVQGYSIAQSIFRAIQRSGSVDGDKVKAELEKFVDEPLLQGPTTFTPTYHFNLGGTLTVLSVSGGKDHFVQLITPRKVPKVKF